MKAIEIARKCKESECEELKILAREFIIQNAQIRQLSITVHELRIREYNSMNDAETLIRIAAVGGDLDSIAWLNKYRPGNKNDKTSD